MDNSPENLSNGEGSPCAERDPIREDIIRVLKTVYDPEIPVNIYELGLVYKIDIVPEGPVLIQMTLTSPACPVAESLPGEVKQKVIAIPGVSECTIDLVWDPPWTPEKMSEAARLELNM